MTTPITVTTTPTIRDTRHLSPVTFRNTALVEARKLVDTPSGLSLVAAAVLLAGVFAGGRALFPAGDTGLGQLVSMAALPISWFVMAMAILLVTGEFTRPAASLTFTLNPNRGRVLAAKATVVVGLALAAILLSLVVGLLVAVASPPVTGQSFPLTLDLTRLGILTGSVLFTALAGFALALALRNAPAPLVVLLAWPTVALLIGALSEGAATVIAWVSLEPFYALPGNGHAWLQLATSVAAWILLPGTIGTWRLLHHDL